MSASSERALKIFIVVIVSFLCISYPFGKNPTYRPSADDAMSYACGYANRELTVWIGCVHDPECYSVEVTQLSETLFDVKGAVVSGNQYCVKEIYYFTGTMEYQEESEEKFTKRN